MQNTATIQAPAPPDAPSPRQRLDVTRQAVKEMLLKSEAFCTLPPDKQRDIAMNTVNVVSYMAAPEGIPGNRLPTATQPEDAYAFPLADSRRKRSGDFTAQAAREGAEVAGVFLQQVSFPEFVSELINGVFHSIVESSIKQMEAYGKLVADVAKSLNQFRDENVSANQARDHLAERFPDTFSLDLDTGEFDESRGPRVRLRDGVDERQALETVNGLPVEGGRLTSLDLDDDAVEQRVVQAARTQLATSRQQLLATILLMGINRIIVTDGRISAKVLYDFRARETFKHSATEFDYKGFGTRTVAEGEYEFDREGASSTTEGSGKDRVEEKRDASWYSKGNYSRTTEPAVKLMSVDAHQTDAALSTRASLAGTVDVNFKSETLPLERMADSFQIGHIQQAAERKLSQGSAAPGASGGAPRAPTPNA